MNTVLFAKATIVFSENLVLVIHVVVVYQPHYRVLRSVCVCCVGVSVYTITKKIICEST